MMHFSALLFRIIVLVIVQLLMLCFTIKNENIPNYIINVNPLLFQIVPEMS